MNPEDDKREIIIVRRGGHDDDHGHHGGVWKIAFADFMTALMCLFLVMWLINATNEQTKASIASYFNPMTLVDSAPSSKGLGEPNESTPARDEVSPDENLSAAEPLDTFDDRSGPANHENSKDSAESQETSDEHLFADPYAVLAEIAAQTAMLQNVSSKGDGGAQTSGPATGADGGESYRDPFAPDFWSREVTQITDEGEMNVFKQQETAEEFETDVAEEVIEDEEELLANEATPPAQQSAPTSAPQTEAAEASEPTEIFETVVSEVQPDLEAVPEVEAEDAPSPQDETTATRIRQEIVEAFGRDSELNKTISVVANDQGIMISVTDELNYGMFEVGSAVPRGELVLAMERIAQTLNAHTGKVRINGHTDARPFRSASYDNWRLSTARAHSAYYMLVRGGLDENRIREVAGYADRDLKDKENPLSDRNRRIEILLETDG